MLRVLSFTVIGAMLAAVSADMALAQRGRDPLGLQKPYYGRSLSRRSGGGTMGRPSYSYRPAPFLYQAPTPQAETYRAFSFEPISISPGDTVVVHRNSALMLGPNKVADVPQGFQFRVTKVIDGWLGAVLELDGRQKKGWIWNGNARLAEDAPPAPPSGA